MPPLEPPARRLPDYAGGGLVNLIASLAAGLGGAPGHPALALLPPARIAAARNVVLLLIDGLGDAFLTVTGRGSELAQRRVGAITSVFPSTTAAAITTTLTGRTPLEHGLTGWFSYFGAAGCVAAPLLFQPRGARTSLAARGTAPSGMFFAPSLFDSLAVRTVAVYGRPIVDSVYSRHHCGRAERRAYDDLGGFVDQIEAAVESGDDRKYVYAYWPELDAISHEHGAASAAAAAQFGAIDAAYRDLLRRLEGSDTLVIATADHGFVDSSHDEALRIDDCPGLAALLRYPLCGEPRTAFCHVQAGRVPEFIARASDWLGGRAEVRASRELATEGWFGPGTAHPAFAERIGDVALLMRDRYTVKDWLPGERRIRLIGNHGGTSREEMMIPLALAQT